MPNFSTQIAKYTPRISLINTLVTQKVTLWANPVLPGNSKGEIILRRILYTISNYEYIRRK